MRYNRVKLSGRLIIEARRKASRNEGSCPDMVAWMRYIAMQKSVASKEPRFWVSARFLCASTERSEGFLTHRRKRQTISVTVCRQEVWI
jgi:hypothetical protein